jgi:hypothetical protein
MNGETKENVMAHEVKSAPVPVQMGHERHCFVVMPFGRTPPEIRWYKGWFDVVIRPAVINSGYEPILSSSEERPSAINDEIRSHLAFDPMVVVDLGGLNPDSDPNPNVMYELGIRHALSLPLVMLAWKGQRLPFDVGNQRVIMESRDLLDLEVNKTKLTSFIRAAASGHYYRPMDAVGRAASLDLATTSLSQDSLLAALVNEFRDLRDSVNSFTYRRRVFTPRPYVSTVKRLVAGKAFRKSLYPAFIQAGGTPKQWVQLLKSQLPTELQEQSAEWTEANWLDYVISQATAWRNIVSLPTELPDKVVSAESSKAQSVEEAQGIAEGVIQPTLE